MDLDQESYKELTVNEDVSIIETIEVEDMPLSISIEENGQDDIQQSSLPQDSAPEIGTELMSSEANQATDNESNKSLD